MVSVQAEIADQRVGHGGCFHLEINPLESSLFINQEGVSHHPHVFASHELLQPIALVEAGDGTGLRIGEQGERELVLVDEFVVGGRSVLADAQNADVVVFQLLPAIAKVAGLLGAAWGVVLGIEVQNNFLPAQGSQAEGIAVLIGKGEVGGGVADLQAHGWRWGSGRSVRRLGQDCLCCLRCDQIAVDGPWRHGPE